MSVGLGLCIFILVTTVLTFEYQLTLARKSFTEQLSVVSDLKVAEISRWIEDWKVDISTASQGSFLAAHILDAVENETYGPAAQLHIAQDLMRMRDMHNYESVSIYDQNGAFLFSTDETLKSEQGDPAVAPFAKKVARTGQTVMSPMRTEGKGTDRLVFFDFIAPVRRGETAGESIRAVAVFRVDANAYLFPLIQKWPGTSRTAETLLVMRDRNYVVYLNELRHKANTSFAVRFDADTPDLTSAMAVRGITGEVEGTDYRGKSVLAALRPISGTPWFLVSKIDIAEVRTVPVSRAVVTFIGLFLLGLSGIVILRLDWKRREQRQLQTYLDVAGVMLLAFDSEQNIRLVNRRVCMILGYSEEELLNRNWVDACVPEEDRERMRRSFSRIVAGEDALPAEIENHVLTRTGERRLVQWRNTVIRDCAGRVQTVLSSGEDITEQRENEEALKEARQRAEDATRAKSEFLANMSHEIRTPLNAIAGFAETLQDAGLPPAQRRNYSAIVLRNCRYLVDVVNDILDLSKIESGKIDLQQAVCRPLNIVRDVMNLMRLKASEKGIVLEERFDYPLPEQIVSDPVRLKQILINLIGNAVKFTGKGVVQIRVQTDFAGGKMRFSVKDSGPGISPEEIGRIFEPFYRGTRQQSHRSAGTGLGLTISRRLSRLLGGDLQIESRPGEGTTCTAVINTGSLDFVPMVQDDSWSADESGEILGNRSEIPALEGRVLLMEDNEDSRHLMQYLVSETGAELVLEEDGEAGSRRALQEHFDLIITDMHMPVMDGFAAVKLLRENGCSTPIIALTADAVKEHSERYVEAGCSDYFSKPFERKRLYALLEKYLRRRSGSRLIDDSDPEYIQICMGFLQKLPVRLQIIENAFSEGDRKLLAEEAHKLASAALYGFSEIGDAARDLQIMAEQGAACEPMVLKLKDLGARAVSTLNQER